ncbi:MAG: malonyl-CoA decarboxylase [Gammaproteobacteria bacterium]|nr:malonyl-CoA decarboxylase [Gammaproteobacteria bacterium]
MPKIDWLERILDSITDRRPELLGPRGKRRDDGDLCRELLRHHGEATGIALAREILSRYESRKPADRRQFLQLLASDFGPDPQMVSAAVKGYRPEDEASLQLLMQAVEPPRQELFRRLNTAPGGTSVLLSMRSDTLEWLPELPELASVDADLRHLFGSWFNRGFLQLERIDWRSPAVVLERMMKYESVHPMSGWQDLRRRLAADRRCFAFFHPALPRVPLIFVEVALLRGIPDRIDPLIDPAAVELDPRVADTAVFFSINNSLAGLRGVSFGSFLIKQVVDELQAEFSQLKTFTTISPMPRFRRSLESTGGSDALFSGGRLAVAAGDLLSDAEDGSAVSQAWRTLSGSKSARDQYKASLHRLALVYLGQKRPGGGALDPVAAFHLANGAVIERVLPGANESERGVAESWGCMVNYRYDPAQVVTNHEAYANEGHIAMERGLAKEFARLSRLMEEAA